MEALPRACSVRTVDARAKIDKIVEIDWWQFLTGDAPVTPIDGLQDGDALMVFNGSLAERALSPFQAEPTHPKLE
jgi:hypothetical protein